MPSSPRIAAICFSSNPCAASSALRSFFRAAARTFLYAARTWPSVGVMPSGSERLPPTLSLSLTSVTRGLSTSRLNSKPPLCACSTCPAARPEASTSVLVQ